MFLKIRLLLKQVKEKTIRERCIRMTEMLKEVTKKKEIEERVNANKNN